MRKLIQGEVVSDKMQKTVVVKVALHKRHPKYHKQYSVHRYYKAHSEGNNYHVGDLVQIQESRPLSKNKRWAVVKKIK